MLHEVVAGLPPWLIGGLLLGLGGSLLVALLFLGAQRLLSAGEGGQHSHGGDTSRRISGEVRRRREFRACLDAIDEPYAEDHVVEGQPVAFYLPKRDVAITFDARAYYRIERSPTHPVLVEHEMPGVHLGDRLPFEVPEVDFGPAKTDDDRRAPVTAAFAELGVPTTATLDEVKSAYRQKVKEVHPDQGGDEDDFKRVREAYTTAKQHAG